MADYAPLPEGYDLDKIVGAAQPPKAPAKEEKYLPLPSGYRLPGSEKEPPSLTSDMAVAVPSGLQQGVYALPETAQGLSDLIESIPGRVVSGGVWAGEKLGAFPEGTSGKYQQSMENIRKEAAKRQEKYGELGRLPSEQEVTQAAESVGIPSLPHAETTPGRIIEAGTKQIPASLIGGPGTALERAGIGAVSGMTGQAAAEPFRGTEYEPYAQIVGSLAGGLGVGTAGALINARSAAATGERASRIAGQVARDYLTSEGQVGPQGIAAAPKTVPDVDLTTAQTLQAQGRTQAAAKAEALSQAVTGIKGSENTPQVQALRAQEEASQEALGAAGDKAAEDARKIAEANKINVPDSFGINGVNPQGDASINVRSMVDSLEKKLSANEKTAWEDPSLQAAGMYKNKVVKQIRDYLGGLNPVQREAFPSSLENMLDAIEASPGSQIDFQTLQDLRSVARTTAQKAFESDKPIHAPSLYGFVDAVGNAMSDPKNIRFGNTYGEIEAWNKARAATKQYYDTFGDNFMGNIADNPKVSPELTLNKLYDSLSAPDNLRNLRETFGTAADKDVADWMVGKLTHNGIKIDVSPLDVQKFMADPKKAALIGEIPDLADRLTSIAQRAGESAEQATQRQFTDRFSDVISKNNPKALVNFLDRHGDMVNKVFTDPAQKEYITALGDSARALQKIRPSAAIDKSTLNNLADNRMFTLLYGRATGAISDAVAGGLAGQVADQVLSVSGGPIVGAAAGFLGYGKDAVRGVLNVANGAIFGGTREQTIKLLQEAAANPELMSALLNKPSPDGYAALGTAIKNIGVKAAVPSIEEASRQQRASGGSVIEKKADALVNETKRNQRLIADHTERMLSMPDDAIVQALRVARSVAA